MTFLIVLTFLTRLPDLQSVVPGTVKPVCDTRRRHGRRDRQNGADIPIEKGENGSYQFTGPVVDVSLQIDSFQSAN